MGHPDSQPAPPAALATEDPPDYDLLVSSDAADHILEARQRARTILGAEDHIGEVSDWRRALVSARDALLLVWLVWAMLVGFGNPPFTGYLLVTLAFAVAVLQGISTGRSTHSLVEYYASEFERERREIRENREHEREEVRQLYAAKGFRDPLLRQIVDTLSADDDRLLKVMMEEELGLSMHHIHHPLLVGGWNFGAALAAGLTLALPMIWLSPAAARVWMPVGGCVLLALAATISARATARSLIEFFVVGVMMAVITGGVAYTLSLWLTGFVENPATP